MGIVTNTEEQCSYEVALFDGHIVCRHSDHIQARLVTVDETASLTDTDDPLMGPGGPSTHRLTGCRRIQINPFLYYYIVQIVTINHQTNSPVRLENYVFLLKGKRCNIAISHSIKPCNIASNLC